MPDWPPRHNWLFLLAKAPLVCRYPLLISLFFLLFIVSSPFAQHQTLTMINLSDISLHPHSCRLRAPSQSPRPKETSRGTESSDPEPREQPDPFVLANRQPPIPQRSHQRGHTPASWRHEPPAANLARSPYRLPRQEAGQRLRSTARHARDHVPADDAHEG